MYPSFYLLKIEIVEEGGSCRDILSNAKEIKMTRARLNQMRIAGGASRGARAKKKECPQSQGMRSKGHPGVACWSAFSVPWKKHGLLQGTEQICLP